MRPCIVPQKNPSGDVTRKLVVANASFQFHAAGMPHIHNLAAIYADTREDQEDLEAAIEVLGNNLES